MTLKNKLVTLTAIIDSINDELGAWGITSIYANHKEIHITNGEAFKKAIGDAPVEKKARDDFKYPYEYFVKMDDWTISTLSYEEAGSDEEE